MSRYYSVVTMCYSVTQEFIAQGGVEVTPAVGCRVIAVGNSDQLLVMSASPTNDWTRLSTVTSTQLLTKSCNHFSCAACWQES